MASTIIPSDLTVVITSSITLNGQAINSVNTLIIPSINEFDKRIMSIPTAQEVTVVAFATGVAAGTFISGDMRYLQITNKDAVNYVRIRAKEVNAYSFDIRLDPGQSFIMGNTLESVTETAAAFTTFKQMDSVNAQAFTAAVDIEYVVASI